jgi:hypothetical protein
LVKTFWGERKYTREQDNILIEQRERGTPYKTIQMKIPGKSVKALSKRAAALGLSKTRLSHTQAAAVRKDLQAVLDGTASFDDVATKFSSSTSPSSLRKMLHRMRHGYYKT